MLQEKLYEMQTERGVGRSLFMNNRYQDETGATGLFPEKTPVIRRHVFLKFTFNPQRIARATERIVEKTDKGRTACCSRTRRSLQRSQNNPAAALVDHIGEFFNNGCIHLSCCLLSC
jgi:hypothetical protein